MPILSQHSMEIISRSAEQTRRIGMRLGTLLKPGDVVCLQGDLGAGKTTLMQGISAGWGSPDQASSPTFVLVNVYRHPEGKRLFHLDAYRLACAQEAEDLDVYMMLDSGPLVVEWPERIQDALPEEHLQAQLKYVDENQRDLLFSANGERYNSLLQAFKKQVYGG
jgi:tRNA threonylcarbamoyladenosine biosynthesis protein TsaE